MRRQQMCQLFFPSFPLTQSLGFATCSCVYYRYRYSMMSSFRFAVAVVQRLFLTQYISVVHSSNPSPFVDIEKFSVIYDREEEELKAVQADTDQLFHFAAICSYLAKRTKSSLSLSLSLSCSRFSLAAAAAASHQLISILISMSATTTTTIITCGTAHNCCCCCCWNRAKKKSSKHALEPSSQFSRRSVAAINGVDSLSFSLTL